MSSRAPLGSLGSLLKAVPLVGPLVGAPSMMLFCGASSYALGKVFIQHFESGGTFVLLEPAKVKEHFEKEFEEGRALAAELQAEKNASKSRPEDVMDLQLAVACGLFALRWNCEAGTPPSAFGDTFFAHSYSRHCVSLVFLYFASPRKA